MSLKYFIITYGCQMNKSDSRRIAAVLEKIGYHSASDITEADLIVVNACSVRQSAVDRIYGKIQSSKSKVCPREPSGVQSCNSKFKIILTGCLLESDVKKLKEKVDYILSIKALKSWPKFLKKEKYFYYPDRKDSVFNRKFEIEYLKTKPKYPNNFSAFIPISTGCDNFCSYCVVPYTRGLEYSRPSEEIITEVKSLIKKGYKEIILLGQNVNSYKWKVKAPAFVLKGTSAGKQNLKFINFPRLLKMINDIPGNFWVRFLTSHPKDFSNELIRTIAKCNKVCEYIHLPVQSGDDEILKAMNRKYTVKGYKNLVQKIRQKIPEATISTDVIVGFPGETKKQFQNTVKLFKKMKFDMAYIAQYSPRAGTTAFELKDNVPREEKKQREKVLTEILEKTALENNQKYIGHEIEVLIEKKKNEFLIGKSKQYKTVKIQNSKEIGNFVKVKIIGATSWGLRGKLF